MKDQTKIIAALLIGAAAGAALGILLAPDSGESTRGGIAEYVNDLVESAMGKARSTADNLKEYGSNAVERARSKFNDSIEDVKAHSSNGVGHAKSKVKATADDLNDSIQQA